MGKYRNDGAADYDLYLSGYSVEPWRCDRVGSGSTQITPCLSMLLLMQPSILRELMSDEESYERGMTARILPFVCEIGHIAEDDGIARAVNPATKARWRELVRNALARRRGMASEPHTVTCNPEAREVFRAFHNESVRLRNGEFKDIEGELGRWRENAVRLALGQCLADNLEAVYLTGEQAERTVRLARWCVLSALEITNTGRMERLTKRANKLHETLAACPAIASTVRDLKTRHRFEGDEVRRLVANFPHWFKLEKKTDTGGRPSEIVTLKLNVRA